MLPGLAADRFDNIGVSLLVAAGMLLLRAGLSLLQRPLPRSITAFTEITLPSSLASTSAADMG